MLLAELTQGALFIGPDGSKWILTEMISDENKIQFSVEKIKVEEKQDELLPD